MDDDEDPRFMSRRLDRRSFVKGAVAAAGAGALLAAGYSFAKPLGDTGCAEVRLVEYPGAKKVGGPAPRGLPLLPLQVDAEGYVEGVAGYRGRNNLDWYRYCGHERTRGLQVDHAPATERLTYFVPETKLPGLRDPWYEELLGEPVHVDDLPGPGRGAPVRWRSDGATGKDVITALVLSVDPERMVYEDVPAGFLEKAGIQHGLVAYVTFCTHFCCVPGWDEVPEAVAAERDLVERVACSCHWSSYDPYTVAPYSYPLCIPEERVLELGR